MIKQPNKKKYFEISQIKIISLDVDGVLTDGILQWSQSGLTSLNFNVKDGSAIKSISAWDIMWWFVAPIRLK